MTPTAQPERELMLLLDEDATLGTARMALSDHDGFTQILLPLSSSSPALKDAHLIVSRGEFIALTEGLDEDDEDEVEIVDLLRTRFLDEGEGDDLGAEPLGIPQRLRRFRSAGLLGPGMAGVVTLGGNGDLDIHDGIVWEGDFLESIELPMSAPPPGDAPPPMRPMSAPPAPVVVSAPSPTASGDGLENIVLAASLPPSIVVGGFVDLIVEVALPGDETEGFEAATATANPEQPIDVMMHADTDHVRLGTSRVVLDFPAAGQPSQQSIMVLGKSAGEAVVTVHFLQKGAELGSLTFACHVGSAADADTAPPVERRTPASRAEVGGDLVTIFVTRPSADDARYTYRISGLGGWDGREEHSAGEPNGDFVAVREAARKTSAQYLKQLQDHDEDDHPRHIEAAGLGLMRRILPTELVNELRDQVDDISAVKIFGNEPHIPWEMMRLVNAGKSDARAYLCDFNQVRTLGEGDFADEFDISRVVVINGQFEGSSLQPIAGLEWKDSWCPQADVDIVEPTEDAVFDALGKPFDLLHLNCHGFWGEDNAMMSRIAYGVDSDTGKLLTMTLDMVGAALDANPGKPLVFMNACSSDRPGRMILSWDNWAKTCLSTGAGAFIGTAFDVRQGPAMAFANAFYDSFLSGTGTNFAHSVSDGRAAARDNRSDATWLAYRAYGRPLAVAV